MNRLKYYLSRFEQGIFDKLHIVRFYYTNVGLKQYGLYRLLQRDSYIYLGEIEIDCNNIFLGPDYLKDEHTLLDCPLIASPHLHFVEAIREKEDLAQTDYIKRFIDGRLDIRRPAFRSDNNAIYYKKFSKSLEMIEAGTYKPVIVFQQNERYYIFDGKHRAAMCAMLKRPVNCLVVNSEVANSDLWHYMFTLIEGKPEYSKHSQFHSIYLQHLNDNER